MRISILSIGQIKTGPESILFEDYMLKAEGLGRSIGITGLTSQEFPESRRRTADERKADEARRLLAAVHDKAAMTALSERGQACSSIDFARWLRTRADTGFQEISFLIGGPDGHDAALERDAAMRLSLGAMTWPHRLVRVMLMEQIYRAVTILAKHPYHRS